MEAGSGETTGWVPTVLGGVGLVLLGVTVAETLRIAILGLPVPPEFVAGVAISTPSALFLVLGNYRLPRADIAEKRYPRIAGWTVAGIALFGGFFTLIVITVMTDPAVQIATMRWALSVGAGGGFLVGVVQARSIERAVEAEREAVRAETSERRRELLEYLNSLLRHEVLNTANVIHGHATLLDEDETGDDDAAVIRDQADELARITKDVRILLKAADEGEDFEPMDLGRIVHEELQSMRMAFEPVEIEIQLPDEVYVYGDDLLRRLFSNLFENAAEHNERSTPRVSVTGSATDDTVTVRIADDGPGVPPDERAGLFDPTTWTGGDHGLGTVIVGRLADRYGGRVELTETGPDGSVFTVELPRVSSPDGIDDAVPGGDRLRAGTDE